MAQNGPAEPILRQDSSTLEPMGSGPLEERGGGSFHRGGSGSFDRTGSGSLEQAESGTLERTTSDAAVSLSCQAEDATDAEQRRARRRAAPPRKYTPEGKLPSTLERRMSEGVRGRNVSASGGSSKYRGVIWHKSNSKWEARSYINGQQRFLGYYKHEEDAARAYDEYAQRIGAKTNFPIEESLSRANSAPAEMMEDGLSGAGARRGSAGRARQRNSKPQQPPPPRAGGGSKGSSVFRGVSWNSNCCKWRAQV